MKWSFAAAPVVVLSIGLAAFLWWRADSRPRPQQRVAAPEDTELEALRNQVSSLQRQLNTLAARQAGSQEESAFASDAEVRSATDPAASAKLGPVSPPTPEEEAQVFNNYFGKLDRQRSAEPRDATWQTQVERKVRDVLTGEIGRSKLQSAECGSTLCRLEVEHPDLAAQFSFMQHFHLSVGTFLPQLSMYSPPGSLKSDVYVSREGSSLPGP